jgi:hypothetical protein
MKIFCAYAFTGEDQNTVTKRMRLVVDTLNLYGHDAYCNRFDSALDELQTNNDIKGAFHEVFKNIERSELVVAIVTSPNRSIGQIMEIGVALSQKKPVYLLEHVSAAGSSYLPELVDKHLLWESEENLKTVLQNL